MPRRPALSRILIVTLLLIALTVPFAQAAAPTSHRTRSTDGSFSLTDFLGRAWGGLVGFWLGNGCGAGPNGRCATSTSMSHPAPTVDNGCILDPNGRCRIGS